MVVSEQDRAKMELLVSLFEAKTSLEEALEKVRHEYEELADRLMPVVYEQLGNGKWFEANAPFSIGCDVCRGTTLELCSNFLKKTEEYRGA